MSTKHIIMIAVGLLVVAALIGCGKDNCASCPETVTPLGTARGFLILDPYAVFPDSLQISGHGEVMPNLDSIKVGDSLIDRLNWDYYWPWEYADAYWFVPFSEGGDTSTYMYKHGDMATITVWGEGRSSSCRFAVLNPDSAQAHITDPLVYADTIAPGAPDTVYWNKVDHVDYYAVMIAWFSPINWYTFYYYYATDTSFVITGSMQPDDSIIEYNVHITPFNGPDPRSGRSNWDGTLLDGIVCSYGWQDRTTIVFNTSPALAKPGVSGSMKPAPAPSAEDIVSNVYKKYGK